MPVKGLARRVQAWTAFAGVTRPFDAIDIFGDASWLSASLAYSSVFLATHWPAAAWNLLRARERKQLRRAQRPLCNSSSCAASRHKLSLAVISAWGDASLRRRLESTNLLYSYGVASPSHANPVPTRYDVIRKLSAGGREVSYEKCTAENSLACGLMEPSLRADTSVNGKFAAHVSPQISRKDLKTQMQDMTTFQDMLLKTLAPFKLSCSSHINLRHLWSKTTLPLVSRAFKTQDFKLKPASCFLRKPSQAIDCPVSSWAHSLVQDTSSYRDEGGDVGQARGGVERRPSRAI
ncbi:hypothetical protein B0H19DRAFT_1072718 [Mycena capillaripes]|nr:hypothetical protein B0H19DRAFT_1072718 [Mycena capillaripes]